MRQPPPLTHERPSGAGPRWRRSLASVSWALPGTVADVIHEFALMLLDVSEAEAVTHGGIEIIDPRSATVLVSFPQAVKV